MDHHAWDDRYRSADLVWSATPNQLLVDEVADLSPGQALDIAAGEGRNAIWLAEQGWAVTAVDFSGVAVEKGRAIATRRGVDVEWIHADVQSWEPAGSAYDLVVVLYLQLPTSERAAVFGTLAHAVAPGGTLLLIGHDLRNLAEGHGGPQDPDVLWTPEHSAACLDDLVVERAETVEREVATEDATAVALDTLVRAHRPG